MNSVLSVQLFGCQNSRNLYSPNRIWKINQTEVFHFTCCLKTLIKAMIRDDRGQGDMHLKSCKNYQRTSTTQCSLDMYFKYKYHVVYGP